MKRLRRMWRWLTRKRTNAWPSKGGVNRTFQFDERPPPPPALKPKDDRS